MDFGMEEGYCPIKQQKYQRPPLHYMKEEVQKMPAQKEINLEQIYKMISDLQRDVALIKKCIIEEPELRADFIERMKDIDAEESIIVDDFGKRYGLEHV